MPTRAADVDTNLKQLEMENNNVVESRWNARLRSASDYVTINFGSFIFHRPVTVMVVTGFLSVTLTALGIKFSSLPDFSDPTKGFETRGTDLSGRVVTWTKLYKELGLYPDFSKQYFRQLQQAPASMEKNDEDNNKKLRRKRQTEIQKLKHRGNGGSALESFFTAGLDQSPCLQLSWDWDFDDVGHISQVIFEASSFDQLFTLSSMRELCNFQIRVNESFDSIRSAIDYPDFYSLPNYATCLNGLFSCTELTEDAVKTTAKIVRECYEYREIIIPCKTPAESTRYWKKPYNCSTIPQQCHSKYIYPLFYFVLSTNIGQKDTGPVYTNMVLPALQWEAYNYLGTPDVTSDKMMDIYDDVVELADKVDGLVFKGVNMGLKFEVWLRCLYGDSYFVLAAWILVYFVIWLYSGSLFFTLSVFLSVVLSMGVAYFVYRLVFRLNFFPFMNFFMVILLVGIGADDTFVLKHIFDTSSRKVRSITVNGVQTTTPVLFSKEDMCDALSHAALSMFVCSATTAAAFYANLVSDITVIKCFGVFAGTTMLVNYLLVVTWLPASIIVLHTYLNPLFERIVSVGCLKKVRKIWAAGALLPNFFLLTAVPRFVMMLKYLWIALFSLIFIGSCVVVFYEPGVALPTRNPMQMFKPSNPLEWYDNAVAEYFTFAQTKYNEPIEIVIVFGVQPIDDNKAMDPNDYNALTGKNVFSVDRGFELNMTFLLAINKVCQELNRHAIDQRAFDRPLNRSSFLYAPIKCFPDQFFEWSAKQNCTKQKNKTTFCCNIKNQAFETKDLIYCLGQSTKSIDVMSGGPIFRFDSWQAADGFVLYYEANSSWTTEYTGLNEFFTTVNGGVKKILENNNMQVIRNGWIMTPFFQNTLWYDLQRSLLRGTPLCILVSVGIALIVAVVTMRAFVLSILSVITVFAINVVVIACLILLGWHLNIVESILFVLMIGLAFDFTLNYAVAYQLSPKGNREHRVATVLQYMGMPVFLAFLTTFVAGLIMLPSTIMAYYQIGLFMVLVAVISWLYSALFFLSLLAVFGPEDCEWALLRKMMPSLAKRFARGQTSTESTTPTPSGTDNRLQETELTQPVTSIPKANSIKSIKAKTEPKSN